MKPINLIIEHRSSSQISYLRQELEDIKLKLNTLQHSYDKLTIQYGAEVQFNNALIDILRTHNIPFRPVYEHVFRFRDKADT